MVNDAFILIAAARNSDGMGSGSRDGRVSSFARYVFGRIIKNKQRCFVKRGCTTRTLDNCTDRGVVDLTGDLPVTPSTHSTIHDGKGGSDVVPCKLRRAWSIRRRKCRRTSCLRGQSSLYRIRADRVLSSSTRGIRGARL